MSAVQTESMWSSILSPRLHLLDGHRRDLRRFGQELAHSVVHDDAQAKVLWCDGDHGFDPYDFAELNLTRGHAADEGADRVFIKRCMTAFQWDSLMTQQLAERLMLEPGVRLVYASPYDALLTHQELQDWEQEDHTRFSLRHLLADVKRFQVPIILACDMKRWWRGHPTLARMAYEQAQERWHLDMPGGRPRLIRDSTGEVIDPWLRREVTLLDFVEEAKVSVRSRMPHRGVPNAATAPPAALQGARTR